VPTPVGRTPSLGRTPTIRSTASPAWPASS